ncbi:hypothetical protein GCM10023149_10300 [Mucilaginibacter gynuensis]|uniref:Uncharacterized protein n=1 Tax=Mucilaginibacter gynuensis TaxID=1302236 RepID=A0ABP8FZI8_9SPHI
MNKFLTAMFFLSIAFLGVHAQQPQYTRSVLTSGVHPGTVTLSDGQILTGYVSNNNYTRNQDECIFYTDYNDQRTRKIYKPKDIAGYSIENDRYKSVPYSGNIAFGKADLHFLYIIKPGAINTLIYYIDGGEQPVWQKGNDAPVSNSLLLFSFKKNILKLVGDNAEIAGKIDRKESGYNLTGIKNIINEYNTWAAAQVK